MREFRPRGERLVQWLNIVGSAENRGNREPAQKGWDLNMAKIILAVDRNFLKGGNHEHIPSRKNGF